MSEINNKKFYNYFQGENTPFSNSILEFNEYAKRRESLKKTDYKFSSFFEKGKVIGLGALCFLFLLSPRIALFAVAIAVPSYIYIINRYKNFLKEKDYNQKMLIDNFHSIFSTKEKKMELLFNTKKLLEELQTHLPNSTHTKDVQNHFNALQTFFSGEQIPLHLEYIIPELFYAHDALLKEYKKNEFKNEFETFYENNGTIHNKEFNSEEAINYRL